MSGGRERLLLGLGLAVFAAAFAALNAGVQVSLNLGLVRISSVPLPIVVFVAFLLGMVTLFLGSLKAELRTQRMLRRYREELGAEPLAPPRSAPAGRDPAAEEA